MVTVFGLGFVGLTTGVGLAEKGFKVYGFDIDKDRLNTIKNGKLPFLEPGLDAGLSRNINKNFFVDVPLKKAIEDSSYIFFCVGTPYGEGGHADLTYLFTAIDQTLEQISDKKFRVLITKSTIPPSTTSEKILPYVKEHGIAKGLNLGVANNPEFLREGFCWEDFINPDRIVFGVNDDTSKKMLEDLYKSFNSPLHAVSHNTGEFIKYLSNTTLAALISFSNEMSVVADIIGGIDTAQAFRIIHQDKRWGGCKMTSYLYPGCGYGGYCLPKDTKALNSLISEKGGRLPILQEIINTNDTMPEVIYNRISQHVEKDSIIGVLGLSFKPDSDDVRDTPSVKIIASLQKHGYNKIIAYDPIAIEEFKRHYPSLDISYESSYSSMLGKADCFVITTAWKEFKNLPLLTVKPIIDCRFMF